MFKIGDKVRNKVLRPRILGTIYQTLNNKDYSVYWLDRYPNWQNKPVYGVKLSRKEKPVVPNECNTLLEFENCPKYESLAYPEEDLILYDYS